MTLWSRRAALTGLASLPALRWARADAPANAIRIGQTLSLTGPFAQTGLIHQIVSEVFVAQANAKGGWLGRPLEYVLYDDQSKPDVARTLYERLLGVDKVDLILGPYGTAAILAAMGVAQRYRKIFIQNTMGVPSLATYQWQFSALIGGDNSQRTLPTLILNAYGTTGNPPKTIAVVTSKFPSTEDMAKGVRNVAAERNVKEVVFLEYEVGTRDFGAVAARIKEAD